MLNTVFLDYGFLRIFPMAEVLLHDHLHAGLLAQAGGQVQLLSHQAGLVQITLIIKSEHNKTNPGEVR